MSWPFKVKSSTSKLLSPAISCCVAPRLTLEVPIVTPWFASFTFVTPPSVSWVVPILASCTFIVTVFEVTAVSIVPSPVKSNVAFVP